MPYDWLNGGSSTTTETPAPQAQPYVREGYEANRRPTFASAGSGLFRKDGKEWWKDTIGDILDFGGQYTDWITQTEEARGQRAEDYLSQAVSQFDKASMDDQDIRRMMTTAGDRSAQQFKANMKNLRGYLGGAGVTGGGLASGLATNYEAQRQFALTDAARTSYEKKVQMDSLDRTARFQAQLALANQMQRDPSVAAMDWLSQAGTVALGEYGVEAQQNAAKSAAKAQKNAGIAGAIGGILGGLGGIF